MQMWVTFEYGVGRTAQIEVAAGAVRGEEDPEAAAEGVPELVVRVVRRGADRADSDAVAPALDGRICKSGGVRERQDGDGDGGFLPCREQESTPVKMAAWALFRASRLG